MILIDCYLCLLKYFWCHARDVCNNSLLSFFFLSIVYSIHKAVLKSKSSINEVNQIAQVCHDASVLNLVFLQVSITISQACLDLQLRIIIKPKPCVGVGPLCNAQQVKLTSSLLLDM